jgi:ketosteroid isomerase-like protein
MPHARSWYGFSLIVVSAAACAPKEPPAPAPPVVDSTAVKAAVGNVWQQWVTADTAGNIAVMAELVDDSIRIDSKGAPPMIGKAAWQTMAETMRKTSKPLSETITPDLTIAVSNDLAYQNGNYAEEMMAGKKKTTDYGRYAAALEKGADGKWRIRYIMAFSDSIVAAK